MNLQNVLDIISISIVLAPIGFKVFILVSQKSSNQKIKNLSERAEIIVTALDQSQNMSNDEKKREASRKLSFYAKEVGIKVTEDQLNDYIESAVNIIRNLTT